jgi:hypothetical protein
MQIGFKGFIIAPSSQRLNIDHNNRFIVSRYVPGTDSNYYSFLHQPEAEQEAVRMAEQECTPYVHVSTREGNSFTINDIEKTAQFVAENRLLR